MYNFCCLPNHLDNPEKRVDTLKWATGADLHMHDDKISTSFTCSSHILLCHVFIESKCFLHIASLGDYLWLFYIFSCPGLFLKPFSYRNMRSISNGSRFIASNCNFSPSHQFVDSWTFRLSTYRECC